MIIGKYIYLRLFEPSDYELTYLWHSDPYIQKMICAPRRVISKEIEKNWVLSKSTNNIKDIYLVNAYSSDFKSLNCNRINDTTDILSLLTEASTALQEHPRYIIVDELLELSIREPKIIKELTKALAVARHYNTFFVCIAQQATKEEIKCKSLFNCRVTFKQVEYSSYQTILGYSPEDKQLSQREFYYLSDSETGRAKVPRL